MILAIGRDLIKLDQRVHEGIWHREDYKGREIAGRTIGIIGFSRVSRRIAKAAFSLGLNVLVFTRRAETADLAIAHVLAICRPYATIGYR